MEKQTVLLLLAFPFMFAVLKRTAKAELKAEPKAEPKQLSVLESFTDQDVHSSQFSYKSECLS